MRQFVERLQAAGSLRDAVVIEQVSAGVCSLLGPGQPCTPSVAGGDLQPPLATFSLFWASRTVLPAALLRFAVHLRSQFGLEVTRRRAPSL